MRISDWSSNLCSSDLNGADDPAARKMAPRDRAGDSGDLVGEVEERAVRDPQDHGPFGRERAPEELPPLLVGRQTLRQALLHSGSRSPSLDSATIVSCSERGKEIGRATSELQSLMRNSYAVFCLKKKKNTSCNNDTT